MARSDRISIVHASLLLFAAALVGKAGYEQLWRGSYWSTIGKRQQYTSSNLPAPRGAILDGTGATLVESRELVRISVAPREVTNPAALARAMRRVKIEGRWIAAATDRRRKWVEVPGAFLPADVAPVVAMHGVYSKAIMDRVYANSAGIRRIVGKVDQTGKPLDGLELVLDDILRGDTGSVRVARDKHGRKLDVAPDAAAPQPGNTVVLTINQTLQDICERALIDAVDSLGATGGDVVVVSPVTGDVLAMASRRTDPPSVANTAVTEPYEPGSTVKPFVAAQLIALGRARPDEVINTYGGHYTVNGRTINDAEEHEAMMTLTDVIKHSSNVGIVRFAERLSPREKYELYRKLGFGTPAPVPLPAVASGRLYEPVRWSKQSSESIMMGYELTVTPLQLATAYAAIANGGELLEPHLVKEIRSPTGEVRYAARRRALRRVMAPNVAATMRRMLRDVVAGGTSTRADLSTVDVAGKSGTARLAVKGHYEVGAFTASFVGLFPDENPQYVVLTKIDRPKNGYYGGVVAGGVTNVVLRAAMAARDAALDLDQLASAVHAPRPDTTAAGRAAARAKARADSARAAADTVRVARPAPADSDPRSEASYVVKLPSVSRIAPFVASVRPVPDVTGLPVRLAARTLHAAGFRVQLVRGAPTPTVPAAGTAWLPGRVVKLSVNE